MQAQDCKRRVKRRFARSACRWVANWWGCEPQAKQFGAERGKMRWKERYFYSPPSPFLKIPLQSVDNYETCQLVVGTHLMSRKWQAMRTRILKLDGLQKSLTIAAINHPGASIFGWRRLCRQQTCKTKAQAEKGCHTLGRKGRHSRLFS